MLEVLSLVGAATALFAYVMVDRWNADWRYHLTNLIACFILGYVGVATRTP